MRTERFQTVGQAVPKLEFQAVVRHWLWYKWLLSHCQNQEQIDDRPIGLAGEYKQRIGYILVKKNWQHGAVVCGVGGLFLPASWWGVMCLSACWAGQVVSISAGQLYLTVPINYTALFPKASLNTVHKYLPLRNHQSEECCNSKLPISGWNKQRNRREKYIS